MKKTEQWWADELVSTTDHKKGNYEKEVNVRAWRKDWDIYKNCY